MEQVITGLLYNFTMGKRVSFPLFFKQMLPARRGLHSFHSTVTLSREVVPIVSLRHDTGLDICLEEDKRTRLKMDILEGFNAMSSRRWCARMGRVRIEGGRMMCVYLGSCKGFVLATMYE